MNRKLTVLAGAIALFGITGVSAVEAGTIARREARQQKRIEQGVKSGELTAREAAKLEREQAKIEADREKALSDGTLTKREKAKLTREQNRASRHIYREKHDAQKRN
jgi:polyhydroxyalkanoate synthesis regulator phasin